MYKNEDVNVIATLEDPNIQVSEMLKTFWLISTSSLILSMPYKLLVVYRIMTG